MNRKGNIDLSITWHASNNHERQYHMTIFLAIREDGMPGGRNKSIGPVTLNEGEIERVLNGVEFEHERRKYYES